MGTNGILGFLTMNVVNSIVGIPIKDHVGLLTLIIVNLASAIQLAFKNDEGIE